MRSFTALTFSAALATSVLASSHQGAHVQKRSQPGWIKRRALAGRREAVGSDASLATVANSTATPTYYNGTALWFEATGAQSACYTVTTDADFIVGLGTDLWPDTGVVSPLCGQSMFIRNTETGANVTVSIQDASGKNYTTLSKAAFSAIGDLVTGMLPIEYYVFNATTNFTSSPVVAAAAVASSPVSTTHRTAIAASVGSTTSTTSSSSKSEYTPTTTAAPTSTVDWDAINAASSASAASAWAAEQAASYASVSSASAASAWEAEQASSSAAAAAYASSQAAAAYASSQAAEAYQASQAVVAAAAASASATSSSSSGGSWYTGGQATYFYQNGVAGACGTVHADTDYVAALYTSTYSGGSNCGRQIELVNDAGASVTVTVADECPTCVGSSYVDLSVSAFLALGTEAQGMIPMKWRFLD